MVLNKKHIIIFALTFITNIIYLVWRALFTLPIHDSWYALLFGVLLLISEVTSGITAGIFIWSKFKAKEVIKPIIEPEDYPHIDVLIATHNEDVDLLYKTVNGCVNMKYPDKSKVHIHLSDDSNRPEVAALAKKFDIGYIGMENNKEAKSGNLNNALAQTNSPLIATFDADMIPYSDFLLETVPFFVDQKDNEKPLGFVQTPQSFYNPDLFQFNFYSEGDLPNEQDFFSREVNILNNSHDAAVYTGSNTVLLRQAINEAGGFPTGTITEDFELGALINSEGYRSISTLEPMASGLTPMDIPTMFNQRIRWARGVVRSVGNIKLFTNSNLKLSQKLVFLNSYLYWWSFLRRIIFIMAPVMFTVFNTRVVVTDIWQLFIFWLPGYLLLQLSLKFVASDIRTSSWGEVQETIFAPYLILPVILETLGFRENKFKVTSKTTNDTSAHRSMMWPHLLMLILTVIGFISFNYNKFGSEIAYGSVVSFWLLVHMYNLTFSVLFFLGRPIYRKEERFLRDIPIRLAEIQIDVPEIRTWDVSEKGLSFWLDKPVFFPKDRKVLLILGQGESEVEIFGEVIRITERNDRWLYSFVLDSMDEQTYRDYLQIIYDGYNMSLARFRDPWVTPFDRLSLTIKHHLSPNNKRTIVSNNKTPYISLHEFLRINKVDFILKGFNFETLYIYVENEVELPKEFVLPINEVKFDLSFSEKKDEIIQFKVNNLEQLLHNDDFYNLIDEWLIRKEDENAVNDIAS
ncbi:glycosyltransferase [Aerococcaceae bacterium DSM 111176]|nr:glycosyltransferase [Aerococcaceae bacterium DSM 111176]